MPLGPVPPSSLAAVIAMGLSQRSHAWRGKDLCLLQLHGGPHTWETRNGEKEYREEMFSIQVVEASGKEGSRLFSWRKLTL